MRFLEPNASCDEPPSRTERTLRVVERLVLASGLVLLGVLFAQLGIHNVLAYLHLVGWGIVVIIAAEMLAFAANTLGWRAAFPSRIRVPSFGRLLLARIAGDSANYLTPTANVGGEFVRVRMLQGRAAVPALVASVMVAKLTQTIGLVVFVAVGLACDTRIPSDVRWGILAGLLLFATVLAGILAMQRRGLLAPALRLAERWAFLGFVTPLQSSIEQIDDEMARIHRESMGRIVLSSASFALGYAAGIVESYLILWFFGIPASLELALAIEVLGVVLNNLMFFVPARVGTQEAGKVLVFTMLGLAPAQGLAAAVVYRIRELAWAFIGLAILAQSRLHAPSLPSRERGSLVGSPPDPVAGLLPEELGELRE